MPAVTQADVNEGYVNCSITASSGNDDNGSMNYTTEDLFFNGQPVPQQPTATLSTSGALTGGTVSLTGGSNWWGSSDGAPNTGPYGDFQAGAMYQVTAPGVYIGTSRATAVPVTNSTVTIPANTYVCTGAESNTVGPNPCTMTPGQPTGTFQVPAGLAPGAYNVYLDETNTTPLPGNGPNDAYQTARGTSLGTAESVTSLFVGPPVFTSAASTTFSETGAGTFSVTAQGEGMVTFSETGALPSGVTLATNGTLSGTPAFGSAGSYPITITATDGNGEHVHAVLHSDRHGLRTHVHLGRLDQLHREHGRHLLGHGDRGHADHLQRDRALPSGVTLGSDGTLAGTPAFGTAGSYPITITATDTNSNTATQAFTLTVAAGAPEFTSAASTSFAENTAGTFSVTANGDTPITYSETGPLPSGVTLGSDGTLAGTPASGTAGSLPDHHHGDGHELEHDDAVLHPDGHGSRADVHLGRIDQLRREHGRDLLGDGERRRAVHLQRDRRAALGRDARQRRHPGRHAGLRHRRVLSDHHHGDGRELEHVDAGLHADRHGLRTHVHLGGIDELRREHRWHLLGHGERRHADHLQRDRRSALERDARQRRHPGRHAGLRHRRVYPITITATDANSSTSTQAFTLTVTASGPTFTSAASTSFTENTAGTFSVTASGDTPISFSETGPLPTGVTLGSDGTLAGTPAFGTAGSYPITITATDANSSTSTQAFTLTVVTGGPTFTSAASTSFAENTAETFSVTASGDGPFTYSETGALPSGVTLGSDGTLAGTPAFGTAGSYPITITATDANSNTSTQAFTLTVTASPPVFTSASSISFAENTPGTFSVTATGDTPITYSETGALPSGVTLASNGTLAGRRPWAPGGLPDHPHGDGHELEHVDAGVHPHGGHVRPGVHLGVVDDVHRAHGGLVLGHGDRRHADQLQRDGFPAHRRDVGLQRHPGRHPGLRHPGQLPDHHHGDGRQLEHHDPELHADGRGRCTDVHVGVLDELRRERPRHLLRHGDRRHADHLQRNRFVALGRDVGLQRHPGWHAGLRQRRELPDHHHGDGREREDRDAVLHPDGHGDGADDHLGFLDDLRRAHGRHLLGHGDRRHADQLQRDRPAALGRDVGLQRHPGRHAGYGTAGSYPITITATDANSNTSTQSFTLTVTATGPTITSASSTTFTEHTAGTFSVTATGDGPFTYSETGALPSGVTLASSGTLAGTPAFGTAGSYPITITARDANSATTTQSFTLTVADGAPVFTSAASTSFAENTAGTFSVTATGDVPISLARRAPCPRV